MNTCKLTIDHHPDTDQCGEDMIHHAVHVEPVNVDAPGWVIQKATRHMCADRVKEHGHFMPHVDPVIKAMADKGLDTVVVLAPDYWDLEDAFWENGHSQIAWRLKEIHRALHRPEEHTAVVIDLGGGSITNTTRKQAWEAK